MLKTSDCGQDFNCPISPHVVKKPLLHIYFGLFTNSDRLLYIANARELTEPLAHSVLNQFITVFFSRTKILNHLNPCLGISISCIFCLFYLFLFLLWPSCQHPFISKCSWTSCCSRCFSFLSCPHHKINRPRPLLLTTSKHLAGGHGSSKPPREVYVRQNVSAKKTKTKPQGPSEILRLSSSHFQKVEWQKELLVL